VTTAAELRSVLAAVCDPEIPVITIEDLGVLRDVQVDGERVLVTLTPTYSGCPALQEIEADVRSALAGSGHTTSRSARSSPGLDHRLDDRAGPAGAARARHRPARAPPRGTGAGADRARRA
jgi:ring-1,2-phenylacetyl-CoA epoxidase subunit PaaD